MPEKACFRAPVPGQIRIKVSAGRVEIVTFDESAFGRFPGFWRKAIYLKACFVESEIGARRKRSFRLF